MQSTMATTQPEIVTNPLAPLPFSGLVMESANNYAARSFLGAIPLYALPIVAGLGILFHIVVFSLIIHRRLFRTSTLFVFLGFISFLDIIFIGFHAVIDAVEAHINKSVGATSYKESKGSNVFCSIKAYGTYAAGAAIEWISIVAIFYRIYGLWRPMDLLRREHPFIATNICFVTTLVSFGVFVTSFWYVVILADPVILPNIVILDCNFYGDVLIWLDLAFYSLIPGIIIVIAAMILIAMFLRSRYMLRDSETSNLPPALKSAKNSVNLLLLLAFFMAACSLTVGACVLHDRIIVKYVTVGQRFSVLLGYMLRRLYDACHSLHPFFAVAICPYYRKKLFGRARGKNGAKQQNNSIGKVLINDAAMQY